MPLQLLGIERRLILKHGQERLGLGRGERLLV